MESTPGGGHWGGRGNQFVGMLANLTVTPVLWTCQASQYSCLELVL